MKLENCVLTSQTDVKLIDFGSAIELFESKTYSNTGNLRGTSLYLAPECWTGTYSPASDIWALGVLLCFILFLTAPFNANTRNELKEKICAALEIKKSKGISFVTKFCARRFISEECKDFLAKVLEVDYEQRISSEEALNHPWIKKYSANGMVS